MKLGKFSISLDKSAITLRLEELFGRVTKYDLAVFLSQLQVLYEAGVPIVRALRLVAEGTRNATFAKVLMELRNDLGKGETLFQSLSRFPEIFDLVFLNVIKVGEAVGDLGLVLKKLSEFEMKQLDLSRRIQAAMTYPLIVFVCALLLVIFLAQFLFTNLMPVLQGQGIKLSLSTEVLIALVTFFRHPVVIFFSLCMLAGLWYMAGQFFHSPFFVDIKDRMVWKIPLFGPTIKKIAMARFCYNISLLHESGISMLKALTIAADSSGNTMMKSRLYETIEALRQGDQLWESLKKGVIFPRSLLQIVRTGESSGKLSLCLRKLAEYYEMEVDYSVQSLSSAMEPIMICIMGFLVGGIIFIAISPIYKVIASFGY